MGMDVSADRWRITQGIGRVLAGLATGLLAWAMYSLARRFRT
jgi:NAD(P)H-hydrate repair Nnr-like enzyme with NAD(P)H-hydrate dehydratase domain